MAFVTIRNANPVRGLAAAALAAALSSACSEAGGTAAPATVRDSAGIEIVENAAPAWADGEGWTLSAEPVLHVGVVDGVPQYQLDRVVAALLRDDGTLLVANAGSSEIRMYGRDGVHIRSVGGAGEGPGEFQSLTWLGLHHDSIFAWDARGKRLSIFTSDGDFVRAISPDALGGSFFPVAVGLLNDGTFVVHSGRDPRAMMEAPGGEYRAPRTYLAVSPDGSATDTLASLRDAESWLEKRGNGFSSMAVIFGRDSHLVPGGDHVVVGESDSYELTSHGLDGSTRRIVRRAHEPVPVTRGDAEMEIEARLEGYPTVPPSAREGARAMLMKMDHRTTLPAFTDLRVDTEGNLWVQEAHLQTDEAQTWSVFDPGGQWLGSVPMPTSLRIRHITEDRLVAMWRDELDVEYVQVYAIEKP